MTLRVAFVDLDDTIYDRTRVRPDVVLSQKHHHPLSGLSEGALRGAIRDVQSAAWVLRRAGFPDVRHEVEEPALFAVATALFGTDGDVLDDYAIDAAWQQRARVSLDAAAGLFDDRSPRLAFRSDALLVGLLHSRRELRELVERAQALQADERVSEMAAMAVAGLWEPLDSFAPAWAGLDLNASPLVVTHGLEGIQAEKLSRLGLGQLGAELVSTERVAAPLDAPALIDAVDGRLSGWVHEQKALLGSMEATAPSAWPRLIDAEWTMPDHQELGLAYPLRWLLERSADKTPEFYARVLHAACASPGSVLEALDGMRVVPDAESWQRQDLRLVVIGDRYRSDVVPVQRLLGTHVGATFLLQRGMHAVGRDALLPGHAPTHTVEGWKQVGELVAEAAFWDSLVGISDVPPLDPSGAVPLESIAWGLDSPFEVARRLAAALADLGPGTSARG